MIKKLNHKSHSIAQLMQQVFQRSYTIEAKLLRVDDFPPLKRTINQYIDVDNAFYGHHQKDNITAVIELKHSKNAIHIQSLVVDPCFFRKGIASHLIQYVFDNFNVSLITVETGLDNRPAIILYEKHGFIKIKEYDTSHGIRKVRLEKKCEHYSS